MKMSFSSSALSGVCRRSVFFLLASGSGGSPGVFWGTKGSRGPVWRRAAPPEAGELQIEDEDLLGVGDDAGTCGVVDVVGGRRRWCQSVDEERDLTGANWQAGVTQPPAKRQQIGLNSMRGDRR